MFKEKLQDYTEDEFLNFLGGLRSSMKDGKSLKGKELEIYWDSSRRTSYQNYTTSVDERSYLLSCKEGR